jgi:predicted acylesterase/phospholipase RssA
MAGETPGETAGEAPRRLRLLALKGGGQKAISQIAVLEALEQITQRKTNELFDVIGGTSAGAINAALLAAGYTAKEILEGYFKNEFFGPRLLFWRSLFSPKKLRRAIEGVLPPAQFTFGKLPCELILVSKNLQDGLNYVFSRDATPELAVAEGVLRSASLPPLFEPLDGQWMDGAVGFNNPTDAMVRYMLSLGHTPEQLQVIFLDSGFVPTTREAHERREHILYHTGWLFDALMSEMDLRSHAIVRQAFPGLEYHLMSFTYSKNYSMVDRAQLPAIYEEACQLSAGMVYDIIERCFAEYATPRARKGAPPRNLFSMIKRF